MVKRRRDAGPNRLAPPPHVEACRRVLAEQGFKTQEEAARAAGFTPARFSTILREGLPPDPRSSTVERLKRVRIYDLLPRRESA